MLMRLQIWLQQGEVPEEEVQVEVPSRVPYQTGQGLEVHLEAAVVSQQIILRGQWQLLGLYLEAEQVLQS